jgi:hypothetical protein
VDIFTLENFLWLQAAIVVFGMIYLMRKGGQRGLRMRWGAKRDRLPPSEMSKPAEIWTSQGPSHYRGTDEERSLNIHFNFNGHSWDAYEALGLPAGATLERAEQAHSRALGRAEPDSKEFYDHALQAIRRHLKSEE